mgnify:CR=1 FL=1
MTPMTLHLTTPPTVEETVAVDVAEVETIDHRTKSTPIVEALTAVQLVLHQLGTHLRKERISTDARRSAVKLRSNASMAFAVFVDLDPTLPSNASTSRGILTASETYQQAAGLSR